MRAAGDVGKMGHHGQLRPELPDLTYTFSPATVCTNCKILLKFKKCRKMKRSLDKTFVPNVSVQVYENITIRKVSAQSFRKRDTRRVVLKSRHKRAFSG